MGLNKLIKGHLCDVLETEPIQENEVFNFKGKYYYHT